MFLLKGFSSLVCVMMVHTEHTYRTESRTLKDILELILYLLRQGLLKQHSLGFNLGALLLPSL